MQAQQHKSPKVFRDDKAPASRRWVFRREGVDQTFKTRREAEAAWLADYNARHPGPKWIESIADIKIGGDTVYLSRYTDGLCIETALTVPGLTFPLNPATLADAFRMLADIAAHHSA